VVRSTAVRVLKYGCFENDKVLYLSAPAVRSHVMPAKPHGNLRNMGLPVVVDCGTADRGSSELIWLSEVTGYSII